MMDCNNNFFRAADVVFDLTVGLYFTLFNFVNASVKFK